MQALILAAGSGSRLGNGQPKCLVDVGGRSMIDHQIAALTALGVESIVVVVGFEHERVREAVGPGVAYVHNEDYADTNSLFSFLLAGPEVVDDVLVLNCDVLFHQDMLVRLLSAGRSAIAFDSDSGGDAEHMKVAHENGRLVEMRKDLQAAKCAGENVGVLLLESDVVAEAFLAAEGLVRAGRAREWVASAINRITWRHHFECVDVAGIPWVEVDYPDDLERARTITWPAIARAADELQVGEVAGHVRKRSGPPLWRPHLGLEGSPA